MMMGNKAEIITELRDEFNRWEELLASLSEGQIVAPRFAANWSIKDVIAHLWAWQQISIAHMDAAARSQQPEYPEWPEKIVVSPFDESDVDEINAWNYEKYRDKPWADVYNAWRDGYLHFVESSEAMAEQDLMDTSKYAWMNGYALCDVLKGSCEHHAEHRGWVLDMLRV
jgi:hypothetical protein